MRSGTTLILTSYGKQVAVLTPPAIARKQALSQLKTLGKIAEIGDISLWEIAMLVSKKRLNIGTDYQSFISLILTAFRYTIRPITPEIANCSTTCLPESHKDPADRLIAATAICEGVPLVTADKRLRMCTSVRTIW